jgi:preprotein translocase subunit SecF
MTDPKYKLQGQRVAQRRANVARKAAGEAELDLSDEEAVAAETRRERAMVVAGGVPARTMKVADHKRAQQQGKPTGKPTGKKRR